MVPLETADTVRTVPEIDPVKSAKVSLRSNLIELVVAS